ncbi:hypothetical protein YpUG050454_0062 [Yersinia pestis biovar Antiqua str. UG05-0454]|nr:hypothetical protein YpUG050454_0062 [Yersinia pestis biovar Antiqua str. UG05-0454]
MIPAQILMYDRYRLMPFLVISITFNASHFSASWETVTLS